jgi:trehalose/maltose transport system substrate-binding protein
MIGLATAAAVILAAIASISVASAGTTRHASQLSAAAKAAPPVPNAAAIKAKYGGQTITFIGGSVGADHQRDQALAARFTKDTGIKVNLIPHSTKSDQAYAQLARDFATKSSNFDVAMIDVVWPGAFAPFLLDLKPKLGSTLSQYNQGIVKNDTVKGHVVGIPWFGDFGMLYYRTDLLKKYGYSKPPTTWSQLFAMAKKIQTGEQSSNPNFSGFVYQGSAYEGLTCDALEWIASSGGGNFIDNGKATINNAKAASILDMFRKNVGVTSPKSVLSYTEGETHTAFITGNAAFMRNWPYAYGLASDPKQSKVVGKFAVAPLPHGPGGHSVATVGGWQLAVNKYSKHPDAAIEWVRYVTSKAAEKYNTVVWNYVPTIPALANDAAVRKAAPYLNPATANVPRATRPSTILGTKYNEGSTDIYQAISKILNGSSASSVLPGLQSQLQALVKK